MSPVATLRNYRLTLIMDSRGLEEGIDALAARYGEMLKNFGCEVKETTHERRDFIRVTDRHHTGDYFISYEVDGPPDLQRKLFEETKLDKVVKRFFVELSD